MSTKYQIIIAVIALIVAFASGRWLAPTKIKTVVQTVTVETKTTNQDANSHEKKIVTETDKPDGTKTIITTVTQDSDTKTIATDNTSSSTTSSKEIDRSSSRTNIYALGGLHFGDNQPVYGAMVSRDVVGPISIGVFGFSNLTFGAAVGVSF